MATLLPRKAVPRFGRIETLAGAGSVVSHCHHPIKQSGASRALRPDLEAALESQKHRPAKQSGASSALRPASVVRLAGLVPFPAKQSGASSARRVSAPANYRAALLAACSRKAVRRFERIETRTGS